MDKVGSILEGLKLLKESKINEFNPYLHPQGQIASMIAKGYIKIDKDGREVWPDGKEVTYKDGTKKESVNVSRGSTQLDHKSAVKVNKLLCGKVDKMGYVKSQEYKAKVREDASNSIGNKMANHPQLKSMAKDFGVTTKGKTDEEVSTEVVKNLIDSWNGSSGSNEESIAIQKSIKEEFGLESAKSDHFNKKMESKADKIYGRNNDFMKKAMRHQYNDTQKFFKDNGIEDVTVYRGMSFDKPQEWAGDGKNAKSSKVSMQALSSFTVNDGIARSFARGDNGVVVGIKVPIKDVFSTGMTGFGTISESELTLLGGEYNSVCISADQSKNKKKFVIKESVKKEEIPNIDGDIKNADWLKKKEKPAVKRVEK